MILVRQVFRAKYGRGDELVALFQEFDAKYREMGGTMNRSRIMTDASGPFFTVVTEYEVESFAAWEELFREAQTRPWLGEWFGRTMPLIESGRRDFYNIVE